MEVEEGDLNLLLKLKKLLSTVTLPLSLSISSSHLFLGLTSECFLKLFPDICFDDSSLPLLCPKNSQQDSKNRSVRI